VEKIVLDTSFLIASFELKVDIIEGIFNACDFKYELFVLNGTINELERLINSSSLSRKQAAKYALKLVQSHKIKVLKNEIEHVDDALVALNGYIIATEDSELKKRLRKKNIKILNIRQKKLVMLEWKMYYKIKVKGHVRVDPRLFAGSNEESVRASLKERFEGYISKELGVVLGIASVNKIGEGVIISGDGAAYYDTEFSILSFKPEVGEVVLGKISDITDFGAFINIGPMDGMIHVSQTMDDFVSFAKSNVLTGKESKRNLKVNDLCRARIIAVSYKDVSSPKIGLTMRQHRLGALSWVDEELKKEKKGKKEWKKFVRNVDYL